MLTHNKRDFLTKDAIMKKKNTQPEGMEGGDCFSHVSSKSPLKLKYYDFKMS